jgi:hypothetical protein
VTQISIHAVERERSVYTFSLSYEQSSCQIPARYRTRGKAWINIRITTNGGIAGGLKNTLLKSLMISKEVTMCYHSRTVE